MTRQGGWLHLGPWRLFGIPLHVDRSWVFFVAFVAWTLATGYFPSVIPGLRPIVHWAMGVAAAVLLFACVLLHELGHALAARLQGIPVAGIMLFIFGGIAQIAREAKRPSVELRIALAGPLVSVLIAAVCAIISNRMPLTGPVDVVIFALVRYLALVNTAILVFNLLPGFPLDGGRVLRAVLWSITGSERRATRLTSLLGMALGLGLVACGIWFMGRGAWAMGLWYVFLGLFLHDAALGSFRRTAER